MDTSKFKVIIIGGGPTGLVAAHALLQADIDFVVLEKRRNITADVGAWLILGPQTLRVLHQLRLLAKLKIFGAELLYHKGFSSSGYEYKKCTDFQELKAKLSHGNGLMVFHRAHLVQGIYDGLPKSAKAKYLTGKNVIEISTTNDGVSVGCSDNTNYKGSMIIGADGVHSTTRRIMRSLALQEDPSRAWDAEDPFRTEYRCMWCSFPRSSQPGECFETTSKDTSIMYLTGIERGWVLCYERLTGTNRGRNTYSQNDVEAFAERLAEYPVTESLKLKDVFSRRSTAGMADIQEGVVNNWSWGRIVLIGDSIHRFTPNAGLGLNNGIQDVVVLSNLLHASIQDTRGEPNSKALSSVFEAYHQRRLHSVQQDYNLSTMLTRLHSWANKIYYFINRFILSRDYFARLMVRLVTSPSIKQAVVLEYVDAGELRPGNIAWEHAIPS